MARIRTIKPGFFKNADLYDAEKASSLPLRVAFAGLWTVADRDGRFRWRPREIKTDVLPHDDVDMAVVMSALAKAGFILKYKCAGEEYGLIPKFSEHQHVNKNEAPSTIPAPPKNSNSPSKNIRARKITAPAPSQHHEELVSGVREQEQEQEGEQVTAPQADADIPSPPSVEPHPETEKTTRRKFSALPDNFPFQEDIEKALAFWAGKGRPDLSALDQYDKFRAHHEAHGSRMADWPAAWRTWFHNAISFTKPPVVPFVRPGQIRQFTTEEIMSSRKPRGAQN